MEKIKNSIHSETLYQSYIVANPSQTNVTDIEDIEVEPDGFSYGKMPCDCGNAYEYHIDAKNTIDKMLGDIEFPENQICFDSYKNYFDDGQQRI